MQLENQRGMSSQLMQPCRHISETNLLDLQYACILPLPQEPLHANHLHTKGGAHCNENRKHALDIQCIQALMAEDVPICVSEGSQMHAMCP